MRKNWLWFTAVGIIFCTVYACSLTFVYVEGDDASSLAYHAMGRNWNLQLPYSPYQGGVDMALSILPACESVLRVAAMSLTGLATLCAVGLILALVFDWLGMAQPKDKFLAALVLLASVPEFFYLGLVYEPPMLGLCFVLLAHFLIRKHWPALKGWNVSGSNGMVARFICTAVLFGLGVSCRWDLAIYGWVVLADSMLLSPGNGGFSMRELSRRFAVTILWGGLAFGVWMGMIGLSGYSLAMVLNIVTYAGRAAAGPARIPILVRGAGYLTLFTPAFALLGAWGTIVLWRYARRFLVFAIIASLPAGLIIWQNVPKGLLVFLPAWIALASAGAVDLSMRKRTSTTALRMVVVAVLLLPWVVGIRATYDDKAWGPGFELRSYDRPLEGSNNITFTIGAGAAVPTQEGERPLLGHFAVLFGGRWRAHVLSMAGERANVISAAADEGLPIYCAQGGISFFEAELTGRGYKTGEKSSRLVPNPPFPYVRNYRNASGKRIAVFGSETMGAGLWNDPGIAYRVMTDLGATHVVAYFNDSSAARKFYRNFPAAMRRIGPRSAVIDIDLLMNTIQKKASAG